MTAEDEAGTSHTELLDSVAPAESPPPLSRREIARIWLARKHPFLLLGFALLLALVAFIVHPRKKIEPPPPADALYADGFDRVYRLTDPDMPLRAHSPEAEAQAAVSSLRLYFHHYADDADTADRLNPHLLLAEALDRLAREGPPELARDLRLEAYGHIRQARDWELNPPPSPRRDTVNLLRAPPSPAGDLNFDERGDQNLSRRRDELETRRRRRTEFLRWRHAHIALDLGQALVARDGFQALLDDFRARARPRGSPAETPSATPPEEGAGRRPLPVWPFELSDEDIRRLPLELGRAALAGGDDELAFREYRAWLADAPPGPERYAVRRVLAENALRRADEFEKKFYPGAALEPPPGGERPADIARRLRRDALAAYELALDDAPDAEIRRRAAYDAASLALRLILDDPAPEANSWDALARAADASTAALAVAADRPPPESLLRLPEAVGRLLLSGGVFAPDPAAGVLGAGLGLVGAGAGRGRGTPTARRADALAGVRARLASVEAGRADQLAHDARYQVARALEAEGRDAAARDLYGGLVNLSGPGAGDDLTLACRLALARLDLRENRPDLAHRRLLGGYERLGGLRLVPGDIPDWHRFARRLTANAEKAPGPERRLLSLLADDAAQRFRAAAAGRRLAPEQIVRLADAVTAVLRRRDFYLPADFPVLPGDPRARRLLEADPALLPPEDVLWRNRFLCEAAWPYDWVARANEGIIETPPFPPWERAPAGGRLDPEGVRAVLLDLALVWLDRARHAGDPMTAERLAALERAREAAVFARTAWDAPTGSADLLEADAWRLSADLLAASAGREAARGGADAMADARRARLAGAEADLRTARLAPDHPRAPEAAWRAARGYFAVERYQRAADTCRLYLSRWGRGLEDDLSVGPGMVRNLLGRSLWRLADYDGAIDAFRENALTRNTPEGKEALYYWGRTLLESAASRPERLGDPARPLPAPDPENPPIPDSALQVFNFLRGQPYLDPYDTRPWRWATFDLARVWKELADREHDKINPVTRALRARPRPGAEADGEAGALPAAPASPASAAAESAEAAHDPLWERQLYERARDRYREALDRYPLRERHPAGVDPRLAPEDYADTVCLRFEAEYDLALVHDALARLRDAPAGRPTPAGDAERVSARRLRDGLSDPARYPPELFDASLTAFSLMPALMARYAPEAEAAQLGMWKGPWHEPAALARRMRNACQFLALAHKADGDRAAAEGRADDARAHWEEMLRIGRRGVERLSTAESAQLLYLMAEGERRLGRDEEADNLYRLAETAARLHPEERPDGILPLANAFWGERAADRRRDHEQGFRVAPAP